MKDWKGNKIQIGQTVLKINFKDMFGGSKSRLIINFYGEDGKIHTQHVGEDVIAPEGYQWTVSSKFLITKPSNEMTICFSSECKSEIPINCAGMWIATQPWEVLCIEGISDNEEDFFKEYFK